MPKCLLYIYIYWACAVDHFESKIRIEIKNNWNLNPIDALPFQAFIAISVLGCVE